MQPQSSFYDIVQATLPVRPAEPAPIRQPAPLGDPTLVVEYPNRCTLSKDLMAQVPELKAGGRFLLVPPIRRGGSWLLLANPPGESGSKIPARGYATFRTHPISRIHFMRPQPKLVGSGGRPGKDAARKGGLAAVANENVQLPTLKFRLGSAVAGYAGAYELVRVRREATGSVKR